MNENDIQIVLKIILDSLKEKKFIWRLEGSSNLVVQGIDVSVRDIDITTNDDGIKIFRTSLKKYIVKDYYSKKIKGPSIICDINGFEIEINYYGDRRTDMFDKTKILSWHNLQVPILPLEDAKKCYEILNRKEKVELISKYLESK